MIADAHCDVLAPDSEFDAGSLEKRGVSLMGCAIFEGRTPALDFIQTQLEIYKTLPLHEGKRRILTLEGMSVVYRWPALFEEITETGLRCAAPVWNGENRFGGGADCRIGLTDFGKRSVRELEKRGVSVDLAHMCSETFRDTMKILRSRPLISHTDCARLCPHRRNLTDEQIRAIIASDGFIGVTGYPPFLGGVSAAAHIRHICELGGERNVGFGSDIGMTDGAVGPAFYEEATAELIGSGATAEQIERIGYENFRRFLDDGTD